MWFFWSKWVKDGKCFVICGEGIRKYVRICSCNNLVFNNGGKYCVGS